MEIMTLLIINILQQHRVLINCVFHQHKEESIYKSHLLCSRTCMFIDLTADQLLMKIFSSSTFLLNIANVLCLFVTKKACFPLISSLLVIFKEQIGECGKSSSVKFDECDVTSSSSVVRHPESRPHNGRCLVSLLHRRSTK